jgi:hypothetical protein
MELSQQHRSSSRCDCGSNSSSSTLLNNLMLVYIRGVRHSIHMDATRSTSVGFNVINTFLGTGVNRIIVQIMLKLRSQVL